MWGPPFWGCPAINTHARTHTQTHTNTQAHTRTQAFVHIPGLDVAPQMDRDFLMRLVRQYPDSYFILNRRNVSLHVRSIKHWIIDMTGHRCHGLTLTACWTDADLPGLAAGVGGKEGELEAWILGHYDRVAALFANEFAHLRFLDLEIESDPTSALQSFLGDGGLPSHVQLDKFKWGVHNTNTKASYVRSSRD